MLSPAERRLLYSLARDVATGEGAIVDAGCFLGGSTVALLSGLRDRPEPWAGPPVASYDLFRVEPYTVDEFFSDHPRLPVGGSFRSRFDANVAGFDVPHVVREGDITEIGWSGGPIEVLFLDVLKSWEINDAVLRDFFPALVPGRSVVVHQDYAWGYFPWIPITVELMRGSLTLIDSMEWATHVYLVEGELSGDLLSHGVRGLPDDERVELLERAIERASGWERGMLEIARASLVTARDGPPAGLAELSQVVARYRDEPRVLECAAHGREAFEAGRTEVDGAELR
jgi:hypothetical protein